MANLNLTVPDDGQCRWPVPVLPPAGLGAQLDFTEGGCSPEQLRAFFDKAQRAAARVCGRERQQARRLGEWEHEKRSEGSEPRMKGSLLAPPRVMFVGSFDKTQSKEWAVFVFRIQLPTGGADR